MIRFEWDPVKARTNQRKHGVTFEDAMDVFEDPCALFDQDRTGETGNCVGKRSASPAAWHCCSRPTPFEKKARMESFASSRPVEPPGRSDAVMTKLVRKTLADSPMTPVRKRKLAHLAERPDSEIDFSDIPPLKQSFWKNAVRNPFYRPVKQQLTVRLDADVVAWLRRQGRGYQTRLNNVLREAMLKDIKKSA
jgi:uncharacterized protein (DUF4415 family)